MTVLVQPSTTPDAPGIIRRHVTGTAEEIKVTLDLLRHSGTLVSASAPRQLGPADPRVTVLVRVRDSASTTAPAPRPVPPRRWVKPVVIGGTFFILVAGIVIGGYLAAREIVTAAAGKPLAAVGLLAVVAALVLVVKAGRSNGACMGLHCSGCGHR
jgi:hypothetical protein